MSPADELLSLLEGFTNNAALISLIFWCVDMTFATRALQIGTQMEVYKFNDLLAFLIQGLQSEICFIVYMNIHCSKLEISIEDTILVVT